MLELNDVLYSYSYAMAKDIELGDGGWVFQMDYDDSDDIDVFITGNGQSYEYTMSIAVDHGEVQEATGYLIGAEGEDVLLFYIAEITDETFIGEYWLLSKSPLTFEGELKEYVIPAIDGGYVPCFAPGTLITTPEGERPVESLKVGELVTTAEGNHVPVKWIGHRRIPHRFVDARNAMPVRIAAGALGEGLPRRDLYVSPDHALYVDGLLVQSQALVNGVSIEQVKTWPEECLEYFHIELAQHDLVLAEGMPAETFVDNVTRRGFDNYDEYVALYGEGSPVPELPLPRVKNRRQLPARIRRRLMDIALRGHRGIAA